MDEACSFRDFECGSGRQVDAPSNGFINAVMAAPTNSCSRCQQYLRNGTTHQIGCNAPYKYISISFLAEQLANEMWQADGTLKTIRHSPSLLSIAEPCVQHPEKLTSHTFGRRSSLKLALGQREATHLTVKEFRLSVASCSACPPTSEFRRVARHIHPSIPLIVIENPASCPDRRGGFPATHWPDNKSVDVWVAGCPALSTPCTRKQVRADVRQCPERI